jgi:hypothetical protein
MRTFLLFLLITASLPGQSQKKLVPVSQSPLTGIPLPAGTKQDSRLLSEMAGKALLEIETKKAGLTIGKTEFLTIPGTPDFEASEDSLKQALLATGWMITPLLSGDPHYFWIDRNNTRLISYLSGSKKEISLYFGETTGQLNNAPQQSFPAQTDPPPNQPVLQTDPATQMGQQNNTPGNPYQNTGQTAAGLSGITMATTSFDDGWVATPQADWVQLSKNNLTAYLHYSVSLPDELVSGDGDPILNYFWNLYIAPRYTLNNVQKLPFDPYAYKRTYFMDATATENGSGQTFYLAFRILINSGIASCIEIKAGSKEEYTAIIPDLEKMAALANYNRFAISQNDLTGKWVESKGGFAQYYNIYNGNYAGMNAVSIQSQLTIGTDGQLLLEHKGAGGMVGNQQFFSEKYNGPYTLTNWDISFTDQNGKQTAYHAFYQAVKNGRILYLQNKQYSGQEYFFVKTE